MKAKLYNSAWESIEFLMFEYMNMSRANGLNKDERVKLESEYIAVRTVILQKFGVTFEELNAETDKIMEGTHGTN
jgi:hypothetical protein